MAAINRLLEEALRHKVELVLLEPGRLPAFRRGGADHEVTQKVLDGPAIERLLAEVAPGRLVPNPANQARFEFDHRAAGARFHFACLAAPGGWKVAIAPQSEPAHPGPPTPTWATAREKGRRALPALVPLLRSMVDLGASDLHLAAWEAPWLRIHGELAGLETFEPPTSARLKELLYEVAPERVREEFERSSKALFALEIEGIARFRIALSRDRQGVGAAIRQVPLVPPSADTLELPPAVRRLAEVERGLVLLAGPPGSGRSSSLAALLGLVDLRRAAHVTTIERPVEFLLTSRRSLFRQTEVPTHAANAVEAIAASRHTDTDVLALADAGDAAALAAAIERAAAGVLVFAVVDAASVRAALETALAALTAAGSRRPGAELAAVFAGAISQKLLRRATGAGRLAAWEIAPAAPAVTATIAEGDLWRLPAVLAAAHGTGAQSEAEALADLVAYRMVEPREALRAAFDLPLLVERLRALDPSGSLTAELDLSG